MASDGLYLVTGLRVEHFGCNDIPFSVKHVAILCGYLLFVCILRVDVGSLFGTHDLGAAGLASILIPPQPRIEKKFARAKLGPRLTIHGNRFSRHEMQP